jgi:tetratricopeptide (TPR) repeat protein
LFYFDFPTRTLYAQLELIWAHNARWVLGAIIARMFNDLRESMLPLLTFILLSLFLPAAVFADEEDSQDNYKPEISGDAMVHGSSSASALCRAAKYQLKVGNVDKAISLSKRSLEENDDDEETHFVYAEALERKVKSQETRDPILYRLCIKEWLNCLRQESGYEKISTSHGLSLPKLVKFYEDEDGTVPAKRHIMRLVGRLPKAWETDAHYLDKVAGPTTQEVSGKLVQTKEKVPAAHSKAAASDE